MQPTTALVTTHPTSAIVHTSAGTAQTVTLQPYMGQGGAITTALIPIQMFQQGMAGMQAPAKEPETLITLSDVVDYLQLYWVRGLIAAIPLAALAFFYLGFGTPVYEAESKLKINIQDRSVLDGTPQSGLSELSAPMIINNHRTGLKSRRFVDFFFSTLTEGERTAFLGDVGQLGLKSRLFIALGLSSPPKAVALDELFAAKIDQAVRIEPVKDSHILRIQLRDSSAQRVAELANQYVESYMDYVSEDSLTGTRHAHELLQKESQQLRTRLEAKQRELAKFRQGADILDTSPSGEVNAQRVESLVRAVTEAEVAWIKASIDLNEMRRSLASGDATSVKGLGSDQSFVEMRKLHDEIGTKRAALLEWCGPRHPKVMAFDDDLARMQKGFVTRATELVSAAESEESRLKNQYEQLQAQLAEAKGEVFSRDPTKMQGDFLKQEARADLELYNQLMARLKQTEIATRFKDTAQLSIADVAVPPDVAVSPRKSIAMLAATMLFGLVGLAVPIGSGIWRDHLVPLFRSVKNRVPQSSTPTTEPQPAAAPSPISAAAPSPPAPEPHQTWNQVFQQVHPQSQQAPFPPMSGPLGGISQSGRLPQPTAQIIATIPELMAAEGPIQLGELLHPDNSNGGAIAQIVATLEKHQMMRQGVGTVLVTSASSSEGKSLLASALAANLCTSGRRVFLMECNPASPSIQNWFPQAGSYSSWSNDLETLRYGASNLFVLPAHDLPSYDMTDLLDGYRAWMNKAQHEVDWIILDGASLLRGFADVAQLAPLSTDILFVHDETRTNSNQVRAALNLLRPLVRPETLRGMVMNRHSI